MPHGNHKPHQEVDNLKPIDSPGNLTHAFIGADPVDLAEELQCVDADPHEQVADGGQDEELLEQEVVQGEDESLRHGQHEDVLVLLGDGVIILGSHDAVPPHKQYEHAYADGALHEPEEAGEEVLVAVEDGRVGVRGDIGGCHRVHPDVQIYIMNAGDTVGSL